MKHINEKEKLEKITKATDSLVLIKENAYCKIFLADINGVKQIIKIYKGDDPALAIQEAEAANLLHKITSATGGMLDSQAISIDEASNIVKLSFVPGDCFVKYLYRARSSKEARKLCIKLMETLGRFLRNLHLQTRVESGKTDPFMFEYIRFCSNNLEKLPLLGNLLFKGVKNDADLLSDELQNSGLAPSYIHGDFVFRNMHAKNDKIGLIDFANAIPLSHTLNDVYNLRIALGNMWLSRSFKKELIKALEDGIGDLKFPEIAHHFYFEYHRRRWLMLKLKSKNPWSLFQAFRGLMSFARASSMKNI